MRHAVLNGFRACLPLLLVFMLRAVPVRAAAMLSGNETTQFQYINPDEAVADVRSHGGTLKSQELTRRFVAEWNAAQGQTSKMSAGMQDYVAILTAYLRAKYNVDFIQDVVYGDSYSDPQAFHLRMKAVAAALNYITSAKQHASTSTAASSASSSAVTQQVSTVFSHVWAVQSGGGNASPGSAPAPGGGKNQQGAAPGDRPRGPAMAPAAVRTPWAAWGQGYGGWAYQHDRGGVSGYDTDVTGLVVGLDRRFSDNLVLGLNLSVGNSEVDLADDSAELDSDTWGLGAYASFATPTWFVDGMLMYNHSSTDSVRITALTNVVRYSVAEYGADQWTANVGGGWLWQPGGGWNLTPSLHLQYSYYAQDSYHERGGGLSDLAVDDYDTDSFTTTLTLKVSKAFKAGNGILYLPEASIGWIHEFEDPEVSTSRYYRITNPTEYRSRGLDPADDSLTLGVGLNVVVNERVSTFLHYDFEIKQDYRGHTLSAGLRVSF